MRAGMRAALVVLVLAMPLVPSVPRVEATEGAMQDRDGDRLADDLEARLAAAAPGARVPVVVVLDAPEPDPGRRFAAHGGFDVTLRFDRAPFGFAAALAPAQARALARDPAVRSVWLDAEVHATLDTAAASFGAALARQDFGADGDGDGDGATYAPADAVVCVVDTGIDAAHADLDGGKVLGWRDFVNNRAAPYDDNGHGTHVAGIVAGTGDGDARFRGVAPGAGLVGVKVLNAAGSGSLSQVQAGVQWCVDQKAALGIEVISMSLGTSQASDGQDSLSLAVNAAADAGLLVVVAAGNSGPWRQTIGSPGAAAKALTVGAMYDLGERGFALAAFSSRGPTLDGRVKPDLAAPGVAITAPDAGTTAGYVALSGTSMATPFVSGVAALLAAKGATAAANRDALLGSAQDWGAPGPDAEYGQGRLRAYEALRRVAGGGGAGPPDPVHQMDRGVLGSAGTSALVPYVVTDPAVPLALTLTIPDGTFGGPDFDLYLYGPGATPGDRNAALLRSEGTTRQELVRLLPPAAGRYVAEVAADSGAGAWILDASGALLEDDLAPVTTAVVSGPLGQGGWFTGPATVSLAATDPAAGVDATFYRVDPVPGLPAQEYRGPFQVAGDGRHAVEHWSVDLLGNRESPRSVEVPIDATAPATTHTLAGLPGASGWWRGPVQVALQGSDALSGLAATRWALDAGAEADYAGPFEVAGDGAHRLQYLSRDVAGNAEARREVPVAIDATPPTTLLQPSGVRGDGGWWRSMVVVTPVAFDAASGVARTASRVDAGPWMGSMLPFDVAGEGRHTVEAFSADAAGNEESPQALEVAIDTVPPATTAALAGLPGDEGWWRSAVDATLLAADATSGVARAFAGLDGALPQPVAGPVRIAGDGTHALAFHARDAAGNLEAPQTAEVRVDATPPATALDLAGPAGLAGWFRGPVQVRAVPFDATSGVAATTLTLDGAPAAAGPVAVTREGLTALRFASRDRAGNAEPEQAATLRLDATPPSVALHLGAPRHEAVRVYVTNRTPFAVLAADAVSGVRLVEHRVDDAPWAAGAAFTLAGPDGARAVAARAGDVAGNDAPEVSAAVFLDDTAPEVALDSPRPGQVWAAGRGLGPAPAPPGSALDRVVAVLGTQVEVRAQARDPLVGGDAAGLAAVEFLVDGAVAARRTAAPWAWTWPTEGLRTGDHTLAARAIDHLGNAATSGVRVTLVDA